jgi:hypothetical protein
MTENVSVSRVDKRRVGAAKRNKIPRASNYDVIAVPHPLEWPILIRYKPHALVGFTCFRTFALRLSRNPTYDTIPLMTQNRL